MKRPPGDNDGSNSGQGECVSRLRSVPSALMIHTSSWLSKAILPDSEESETGPPPVPGPEASGEGATGGAFGPPVHAPTTRTTAKQVVRMRPHLMPLSTPRLAGRFPARPGSDRAGETQRGARSVADRSPVRARSAGPICGDDHPSITRSDHGDGALRFTLSDRPWPGARRASPPLRAAIGSAAVIRPGRAVRGVRRGLRGGENGVKPLGPTGEIPPSALVEKALCLGQQLPGLRRGSRV